MFIYFNTFPKYVSLLSCVEMNTFASLVVSIASIAGLCSTANMLLFRVFADMVERNHVFILRMALKLRSAVADEKPTELYNRRSVWTWGAHFLKDGLKFIMFITDATAVTDVIGILLSALKRFSEKSALLLEKKKAFYGEENFWAFFR